MALVARAVAIWSCFRSIWLASVGSSNDWGNSVSRKKGAAANPTPDNRIDHPYEDRILSSNHKG